MVVVVVTCWPAAPIEASPPDPYVLSFSQFEKDRLSALEAVVSNHKDTIEGLEAELAKALGVESIHAEQFLSQQSSKNVVESKKAHDEKTRLSQEVSQLKQLLDR